MVFLKLNNLILVFDFIDINILTTETLINKIIVKQTLTNTINRDIGLFESN